jgi:hypothetical protein
MRDAKDGDVFRFGGDSVTALPDGSRWLDPQWRKETVGKSIRNYPASLGFRNDSVVEHRREPARFQITVELVKHEPPDKTFLRSIDWEYRSTQSHQTRDRHDGGRAGQRSAGTEQDAPAGELVVIRRC